MDTLPLRTKSWAPVKAWLERSTNFSLLSHGGTTGRDLYAASQTTITPFKGHVYFINMMSMIIDIEKGRYTCTPINRLPHLFISEGLRVVIEISETG